MKKWRIRIELERWQPSYVLIQDGKADFSTTTEKEKATLFTEEEGKARIKDICKTVHQDVKVELEAIEAE